MSFLLPCPNCGPRDVNEFAYAGEVTVRPRSTPSLAQLTSYVYFRRNVAGVQREWWFHRLGCEEWFHAERDTTTNEVLACELVQRGPHANAPRQPEAPPVPEAPALPDTPAV